eukprot:1614201-Pyramimonas_sp.AAC.1
MRPCRRSLQMPVHDWLRGTSTSRGRRMTAAFTVTVLAPQPPPTWRWPCASDEYCRGGCGQREMPPASLAPFRPRP